MRWNVWQPGKTLELVATVEAATRKAVEAQYPGMRIVHHGDSARDCLLIAAGIPLGYPANKHKARFFTRGARRGIPYQRMIELVATQAHLEYAIDVVVNRSQNHQWYAWAKCGNPRPTTLRGQVARIRNRKLYLLPGYEDKPYPREYFVSVS